MAHVTTYKEEILDPDLVGLGIPWRGWIIHNSRTYFWFWLCCTIRIITINESFTIGLKNNLSWTQLMALQRAIASASTGCKITSKFMVLTKMNWFNSSHKHMSRPTQCKIPSKFMVHQIAHNNIAILFNTSLGRLWTSLKIISVKLSEFCIWTWIVSHKPAFFFIQKWLLHNPQSSAIHFPEY